MPEQPIRHLATFASRRRWYYGAGSGGFGTRRFRIFTGRSGFTLVIGPWAARFAWSRKGYFANGSHYFTGWHRWADEPEY